MNKEEIVVSAEVKTFLCDLYSQIEYELQEQYKDEVQKLQAKVNQLETNRDEAINIIKNHIGCEKKLGGILLFPTKRIIDALERGKE